MTLLIGIYSPDYALMLSDRRASFNGRAIDDKLNKCGYLRMAGVHLAYAFTGIARVGTFNTDRWIAESLVHCGEPDFEPSAILHRLCDRLTAKFRATPALYRLPLQHQLLTIFFAGFVDDPKSMAFARITNSDDKGQVTDRFRIEFRQKSPLDGRSLINVEGAVGATRPEDFRRIQDLIEQRIPAHGVVGATVKVMRAVAERPASANSVSKDIMSFLLTREPAGGTSSLHVVVPKREHPLAVQVIVTRDVCLCILDGVVKPAEPDGVPLVMPAPRKSTPCWCGSGRKARKCCVKLPKTTITFETNPD